jgi:hypothetical protein
MSHAPSAAALPAANWQITLVDQDESETQRLRESFREHCIESHGLEPRRAQLRRVVRPQKPHDYPAGEMSLLQKASFAASVGI